MEKRGLLSTLLVFMCVGLTSGFSGDQKGPNFENAMNTNHPEMLLALEGMVHKLIEARTNDSRVWKEIEFLESEVNLLRNELNGLRENLKSCRESQNVQRAAENDHVTLKWMQSSVKELQTEVTELAQVATQDRELWRSSIQAWTGNQSNLAREIDVLNHEVITLKVANERAIAKTENSNYVANPTEAQHDHKPCGKHNHHHHHHHHLKPHRDHHRNHSHLCGIHRVYKIRSKKQISRYFNEFSETVSSLSEAQMEQQRVLKILSNRLDYLNETHRSEKESKARAEKYLFQDVYTKISNLDEQIQNGTKMEKQAPKSHESHQTLRHQMESISKEQKNLEFSIAQTSRLLTHDLEDLRTEQLRLWNTLANSGANPQSKEKRPLAK
ncbi:lateral signaling target protein 2 homolog [Tigriopus californicus]|uniref:lateral signaling target protein 2 homolog n=1 Tax=Tigriopus californicus TaxID=6832 RepID=UPI0027DA3887|nr:lateral signaling target protein 2 homolog [Tigriopus californicus]